MKTKKMNLNERLLQAQRNVRCYETELCLDLIKFGEKSGSVEWDINQLKNWVKYIKNTSEMHGITFNVLLL